MHQPKLFNRIGKVAASSGRIALKQIINASCSYHANEVDPANPVKLIGTLFGSSIF